LALSCRYFLEEIPDRVEGDLQASVSVTVGAGSVVVVKVVVMDVTVLVWTTVTCDVTVAWIVWVAG
jgi:hypothetical protein